MLLHWLPRDFFLLFWCKWKLFTLKTPGFHAPVVLKTLLHGKKVPKLACRALARANSQVGAPSRKLARANSGVGAPSPDLARAKCTPTDPTINLHTIVVTGNSVPHLPLHTWHEESIVPSFFVECAKECVKQCARDVLPDDESSIHCGAVAQNCLAGGHGGIAIIYRGHMPCCGPRVIWRVGCRENAGRH